VVLLSPHRLRPELADLAEALGPGRPATLLAELSKRHERAVVATLGELRASDEVERPRGEYVLVVGPAAAVPAGSVADRGLVDVDPRATYAGLLEEGLPRRDALRETGRRLGLRRSDVYRLVTLEGEPESRR
jgi:16S rRNA (cytidine1402-2'-O)-methyltransferase